MSKSIRGGHNFQALGARGILDETTEDRKVYPAVIKYLKMAGETVFDVTPPNCDTNTDLAYGVGHANSNGCDFFASIHFNKAYDSYNGAIGSEVWLNPNNAQAVATANRILANLHALGFINRGIKDGVNGEHLYEVKNTNMTGMIVEVCFVEATEDVALYNKVGYDAIGKAIAEGIVGHSISSPTPTPAPTPAPTPTPTPTPIKGDATLMSVQSNLNRLGFRDANGRVLVVDGINGANTTSAVKAFQSVVGITVDGVAGNQTINCIQQILAKPLCGIPYVQRIPTRYIQWRLGISTDGVFGNGTASAVKTWQKQKGLSADGVVGNASWTALIG